MSLPMAFPVRLPDNDRCEDVYVIPKIAFAAAHRQLEDEKPPHIF
jgi:hypothetical protein